MLQIRLMTSDDLARTARVWNQCVQKQELLCLPLTEERWKQLERVPGGLWLVAENDGVFGFLHGVIREGKACVDLIAVSEKRRRQGIGRALTEDFERRAREAGCGSVSAGGALAADIPWYMPETEGHWHQHMPGVPLGMRCFPWRWRLESGYPFFRSLGYADAGHVVGMHAPFSRVPYLGDYERPQNARLLSGLKKEGVRLIDRPMPGEKLDYEGICARVGSEYWRDMLRTELTAWETGGCNEDPRFWPDGRKPVFPRPILMFAKQSEIIGFCGPVDVHRDRRAWFTGLCVDPQWRGRQLGRMLFEYTLRTMAGNGAKYISLYTGADNPARRIYEREKLTVSQSFAIMRKELE